MGTTSITSNIPVHSVTHAWAGTANASVSIEYVDGTEMRRNLVLNPSFATSTAQWSATSSVVMTRDTNVFHSGPASGKFVANGTAGIVVNLNSPVDELTTYTASLWVNIPTDLSVPMTFRALAYNGSTSVGSYITAPEPLQYATGGWTQVSFTFDTPAAATNVSVQVSTANTPANGNTFYLDDAMIETGPGRTGEYFDGSTPTFSTFGQSNPDFVDGWAETRSSRTVVNPIVGGGVDYILYPADLRSGTMTLVFLDEQDAIDCFQLHAKAAVFTITDTDRPSINMNYIVNGSNTRTLNDQNRTWWTVAIQYQEVGAI